MPQACAVPLCREKKGGHKFPRDKAILKKWIIAIRRDKFTPGIHSRVCRNHFQSEDYTLPKESMMVNPNPVLKKNAVPSKFSWNKENFEIEKKQKERSQRALRRQLNQTRKENKLNLSRNEEKMFCILEYGEEINIESINKDVEIQCSLCECKKTKTISSVLSSFPKASEDSSGYTFSIENYKNPNRAEELKFYVGFNDYDHFMFVFNLFGDEVSTLLYYPSMKASRGNRALSACNEFFLTLIKLRRNMCNKELSFKFKISPSSVSNIFITWINYLYCKFKEINLWVPKEVLEKNLKLRGKSNPCTIIIDCTEIKIEKPKNPLSQQSTYSTYKSANTLKVLVGISVSGCVTFVSNAYGGSISDRELFQKCGLTNKLQPKDVILADRGFNIQDLLCHKDIIINTPEFLNKSGQFETHELMMSKKVSSHRIHIERVIGLGKTYKILTGTLVSSLVPLGDRIIFVCFMLANFRTNIL